MAWGLRGLRNLLAVSILVLSPAAVLAGYAFWKGSLSLLVWSILSALIFRATQPSLGIGGLLLSAICAVAGMFLGVAENGWHFWGGLIPGLTFFATGAMKGTTMVYLEETLSQSETVYCRLVEAGQLWFPDPAPTFPSDSPGVS